jgi:hypothetical protein
MASRLAASHSELVYAVVPHSDALLDAVRKRIDELEVSYETVEAISGIQSGYGFSSPEIALSSIAPSPSPDGRSHTPEPRAIIRVV